MVLEAHIIPNYKQNQALDQDRAKRKAELPGRAMKRLALGAPESPTYICSQRRGPAAACGRRARLLTVCFPLWLGAGRPLGVQPHTGSSSEEGAGVPGWHQGTLGLTGASSPS